VVAGVGLFLLTDVTLLVSVVVVAAGLVLLVAPSVVLFLAEFT